MTYSSMSVSAAYKRDSHSPHITWPAEIPAQICTVSQFYWSNLLASYI